MGTTITGRTIQTLLNTARTSRDNAARICPVATPHAYDVAARMAMTDRDALVAALATPLRTGETRSVTRKDGTRVELFTAGTGDTIVCVRRVNGSTEWSRAERFAHTAERYFAELIILDTL